MDDPYILAPIISSLGVLFVIGYVFGQRMKTRVNRTFLRFGSAVFFVVLLEFFIRLPLNPQMSQIATKIAGALFFSLAFLFYDFVCAVINRPKSIPYKIFLSTTVAVVVMSLFIEHHQVNTDVSVEKDLVVPTVFYIPFFILSVLPAMWALCLCFMSIRNEQKGARKRKLLSIIMWSLVGSILFSIIVLIVIPIFYQNYELYRLTSLGALIQMGFLFWAIIRYNFMSVDIEKISEVSQELFKNVDEGIILMDHSGKLIQANSTAKQILGDSEIKINRTHLEKVVVDYDFTKRYSGHKTICKYNREERKLIISQTQVGSPEESVFRLLILRDVTEQSALEDELYRKRQLESLGILAGGIAHDFNNLLTGILSTFSLLRLEKKVNNEFRDILKEGQRATFEAAKLTQQADNR
jgi:PAS domain-containing protein